MRQVMSAGSGVTVGTVTGSTSANAFAGNVGSGCFAMAIDLETSQGTEISGLNAEEQSDISMIARYSAAQQIGFIFDVYTYVDTMIVLKENNVIFILTLGNRIDSIKLVNCVSFIINELWNRPSFAVYRVNSGFSRYNPYG